ncbi:MAG: ParB/RepB/Spo0J family partition protein [Blastocatellia bacterium]|nr:ParB/RepB/Spo0J family partition protein [Blastocatellia bacterium]MBL8196685.1 ParB/RepB/Spo0J family partition protein [Blastocatellia bacterium]MBN8725199.1 ParB/RepB/Spo0J family partition protein [Acidobacteriota bacterium]
MSKKALGKGLSALLPPMESSGTEELLEIDLDLLEVNDEQPRTVFNEQKLNELAESIEENGLVQPILVRRKGNRFQIIAGERRWRAAQKAQLLKIPAIVKEIADDKLLELALVENIARQELNAIEEALAYQKLISSYKLTQEQVARRVGKERSSVANIIRLLKLPEEIQQMVATEKISMGHARALLRLEDLQTQLQIAQKIINFSLSVREVEKLVEQLCSTPIAIEPVAVDPNVKDAEKKLQYRFGTQVKIHFNNKNGGRIQIDFHSEDELDRLYEILIGKATSGEIGEELL